jgi:hypothetical protein
VIEMGDRVSVQFKNGRNLSVVLFSHWRGRHLLRSVENYHTLLNKSDVLLGTPLGRKEPNTVMVDFVRWITTGMKVVDSDLYFGKTKKYGDNSNNGHWVFDLKDGKWFI